MSDLARLGIQVESSQAAKASGDLDRLTASSSKAEKATDSLKFSSQELSAALKANGNNLEKATAALAGNAKATGAVAAAQKAAAAQTAAATAANTTMAESLGVLGSSAVKAAQVEIAAYEATAAAAAASAAVQVAANSHVAGSSRVAKESLVLLREASRGSFTNMFGSATLLLQALGLLRVVLIPLGIAAAVFGSAFLTATQQINYGVKGTGDLTRGLGLTAEQLERVERRTVSFGDTVKATFQVLGHNIYEALGGDETLKAVESAWNTTVHFLKNSIAGLVGLVVGSVRIIEEAWKAMPKVLGGQGTTEDIDFAKAFKSGVYDSIVTLDKFYSDVADKARKNRIAKILEEAGKAGTGNRHIDNALRQLAEAKNELQVQTSLNAALSAGTLTMADYNKQVKIDADLKSLVAQRDADLIENTKQSREEAAKLTAIIAQLRPIYAGLYDQEIQARQIAANDNLREQNLILERQIELAGQAADIRAIELDQFREMRRLKSLGIDPNSSIGQSALGLAGDASRRQIGAERSSLLNDVIDSGTGLGTSAARATLASPTSETFLKQQRAAYAEIDALRQQDVLSETQAAQAKAQVNDEMNQRRLQNAEGFFGALTGLSSASNDNLAAIGKQAALTSALVSAYSAINKAWDSAPFPANLGAVATVTAQTFANVAAIEGFKQGGYTGGGSRDAVAGVVHGQEWVSNAETTARNRNTLAAMAAGASFDRGMGLKIEVIHDGSTGIQVRQMSDGKVRIIAQQVLADERDGIVTEAVATSARLAPNWVADANKKPRRRSG